jgi:uncharacterized protein (UPF0332 family)
MDEAYDYLAKARENLAGAESEFASRRFNSCARGAYYACFQAAIAALTHAGIVSPATEGILGHDRVQASFVGQLIQRRKLYPARLRRTLTDLLAIRHKADYRVASVSRREASLAVRRTQEFLQEIEAHLARQGET